MSERTDFIRRQAAALQAAVVGRERPPEARDADLIAGCIDTAERLAHALGLTDAPAPECYAIPKAVCHAFADYFVEGDCRPEVRAMLDAIQHARGAQA